MKNLFCSKISLRSFVAIALAFIMLFSCTACNRSKNSDGTSSKPSGNSSGSSDSSSDTSTDITVEEIPGVEAAALDCPEPLLTESPKLLKEFAAPKVQIPVADFSDSFGVEFGGSIDQNAPQIATITEQAGPNDSVSVYGTGFEGATVFAYGLEKGVGKVKQLITTVQREDFLNAVIDKDFDYGMYIIYIKGKNGAVSYPVRINAPEIAWTNATKTTAGGEIRIYGKFLTINNADGENAKSYVYLTNESSYFKATVTEANPYCVTAKLPTTLKDGNYKLWVHNGHGGGYGFSNSTSIEVNAQSGAIKWSNDKSLQKTANPDNFRSVIEGATDGTTITLKNGVYILNQQLKITKNIRILGESKEGVIIVCVFTKDGGSDSLPYGDTNVNSKCKAAVLVTANACEIKNITFTDYVEGGKYSSYVKKPENYHIDYAYGTYIRGNDKSDTGIAGQFKIDNCNFLSQRTFSRAKCPYTTAKQQEAYHQKFEKQYKFYSRSGYGAAPIWMETDRSEITNCYFETPRGMYTRHMHNGYIHGNTFVGTWVMAGNSGSSAILDNNTRNIDISNNRIYGMDEITDPDGYAVTGDQVFARTISFQKANGASRNQYIMNNVASRVGELNYNSGEHILFEEVGVTYVGLATLSNNNKTLHLKDMPKDKWTAENAYKGYITGDDGKIKAGYARKLEGQVIIISKGKGQGQWRTIAEAAADRTVTIDYGWDVQPDQNSTFVIAPGFITPVIYGNKIEGPKLYYKNYNSTNGVNAYATMVGTIIDRNHFSQMQAGVVINPQYNMKSYTYEGKTVAVDFNFTMYSELLVMNNTIKNTRFGIWDTLSMRFDGNMDIAEEPLAELQLCSVIRNNTVSDQRRLTGGGDTNNTVDEAVKQRGGISIVVGRDYWEASHSLSTRYWITDVVVENNKLSNAENGYFDFAFSQNRTIVRNNTYDGKTGLSLDKVNIKHNKHNSGKTPQNPVYFK